MTKYSALYYGMHIIVCELHSKAMRSELKYVDEHNFNAAVCFFCRMEEKAKNDVVG